MKYGHQLASFQQDYNLRSAYNLYTEVVNIFKSKNKRLPACNIYIGSVGEKRNQLSTVTVRWEPGDSDQAARDYTEIAEIAQTLF